MVKYYNRSPRGVLGISVLRGFQDLSICDPEQPDVIPPLWRGGLNWTAAGGFSKINKGFVVSPFTAHRRRGEQGCEWMDVVDRTCSVCVFIWSNWRSDCPRSRSVGESWTSPTTAGLETVD